MFFILFLAPFVLYGVEFEGYLYNPKGYIQEKATVFIQDSSKEVFEKSGVSVYMIAQDSIQQSLDEYKKEIEKSMNSPFVYIIFLKNDKKIDIAGSEEILSKIDKTAIYWDYIVPFIPKDKEMSPNTITICLMNGYVALVDHLRNALHIELKNEYIPDDKGIQTTTRAILYFMFFSLFVLFIIYLIKARGKGNG
ncbi:hypothetical protein [Helicobacter monodelphidis]|uniref:hypothetical protein n=1 Tax=Helicobacter sp. 15-1451 TaxID=2004995 RepID=UPI0015EB5335|nr:hypothetical protein [Helicobacter sp. 15-1451]